MSKYIIIDAEAIQKRMEELEDMKDDQDKLKDPRDWSFVCGQLDILNFLLSKSTPLIPEIEKAYEAGKLDKELSLSFDNPKGRFIANLKFDV